MNDSHADLRDLHTDPLARSAWRAIGARLEPRRALPPLDPDLLRRALRRERALARAGHWAYDLNRHLALAQALAAEGNAQRKTAPPEGDAVID